MAAKVQSNEIYEALSGIFFPDAVVLKMSDDACALILALVTQFQLLSRDIVMFPQMIQTKYYESIDSNIVSLFWLLFRERVGGLAYQVVGHDFLAGDQIWANNYETVNKILGTNIAPRFLSQGVKGAAAAADTP